MTQIPLSRIFLASATTLLAWLNDRLPRKPFLVRNSITVPSSRGISAFENHF
jgi:hypothetical protein